MLFECGCGGSASTVSGGSTGEQPQRKVGHTVVATYHNDNGRSGVNATETTLTPATVNVNSFGRVAAIAVQGEIYAQPLYVPNVTTTSGVHNLVFVATQHDQLYAFDADTHSLVWQRDFLGSDGRLQTLSPSDVGCDGITPEVESPKAGIRPGDQRVVRVGLNQTSASRREHLRADAALRRHHNRRRQTRRNYHQGPPLGGEYGAAQFDPRLNNQRSALLLSGGKVYVAWASHCDAGFYQGWLMSFDESTLHMTTAWTSSPAGNLGGIWMAGGGPSADATGDIYLAVGNGGNDAMMGGQNYGNSVVRMRPSADQLTVIDYFTPYDFGMLNDDDYDLGASAPVLLPDQPGSKHPHLLTTTGKDGTVYLLDRDNLGHWQLNDDSQIVQEFEGAGDVYASSTPALWNNTLYFGWSGDPVRAYAYHPAAR